MLYQAKDFYTIKELNAFLSTQSDITVMSLQHEFIEEHYSNLETPEFYQQYHLYTLLYYQKEKSNQV